MSSSTRFIVLQSLHLSDDKKNVHFSEVYLNPRDISSMVETLINIEGISEKTKFTRITCRSGKENLTVIGSPEAIQNMIVFPNRQILKG